MPTAVEKLNAAESGSMRTAELAPVAGPGRPVPVPSEEPDQDLVRRRQLLFTLSAVILGVVFVYCAGFGFLAYTNGESELEALRRSDHVNMTVYMAFVAAMRPFELLSATRYLAVFLGFIMIVLGSLFILVYSPGMYRLRVVGGDKPGGAFETASPGLVLATLGSVVVILSLYRTVNTSLQ